jgi:hypothetical protein
MSYLENEYKEVSIKCYLVLSLNDVYHVYIIMRSFYFSHFFYQLRKNC